MIGQRIRPMWWHVHDGPPYRCHGGGGWKVRHVAEDLAAVLAEDGIAVAVVESLDPPEWCSYRVPGWVSLPGAVEDA